MVLLVLLVLLVLVMVVLLVVLIQPLMLTFPPQLVPEALWLLHAPPNAQTNGLPGT